MGDKKESYDNIKIKPASNGWILCYTEKKVNPMEAPSTFGSNMTYYDEKVVFEQGKGVSNEQALDNALAEMKKMLLTNEDMD